MVIEFRLKSDMFDTFWETMNDSRDATSVAPGFLHRTIVHDQKDPLHLFYISVWESEELCNAYRASEAAKSWGASRAGIEVAETRVRHDCDVDELTTAKTATTARSIEHA